jgi:hypothetical protein
VIARAAVAADLFVDIADGANEKLLRQELRGSPIEMKVVAVLIVGARIL